MGKLFQFKRTEDKIVNEFDSMQLLGKKLTHILIEKIKPKDQLLNSIGFEVENKDDLIMAIDFDDWDDIILFKVPFDGTETISELSEAIVNDIMQLRGVV